jgi:uncharacterized protein YndB with AHSA1/START domain
MTAESILTLPSDLEIAMTRSFKAPAQLVFDMWTKPEHVSKWYGVRGTTVTACDIDLRIGGKWRWVNEKPGVKIAFCGEFLEIDPPRRLQRTECFEGMPGANPVIVTLTFSESGGQTELAINMRFKTKHERDMTLKSGMELGVKECLENIEKLLAA